MADSCSPPAKASEPCPATQPRHVCHALSRWVLLGTKAMHDLQSSISCGNGSDLLLGVRLLSALDQMLSGLRISMRGEQHIG